jgi:hypothetical protein
MAIAVHPGEELTELCKLVGSQAGVGRVLGRPQSLISRWCSNPDQIRPNGLRLINDACVVALKTADIYPAQQNLEWLLMTRRPELGFVRPAALIQAGKADDLLGLLDAVGSATADAELTAEESELVDWFAAVVARAPEAPVAEPGDEEEEDDNLGAVAADAWLTEAWRGGATMSSDRWDSPKTR